MTKANLPIRERLFAKTVQLENDCVQWVGSTNPNGYGQIGYEGKICTTHRLSWILANGEIPNGLWVLHKCDFRACINPDHLFLGTARDNTDDMVSKGRYVNAMLLKTHCPQGHEFSPENTYRWRNQRLCRTCQKAHQELRKSRRQAKAIMGVTE